MVLYHNKRIHFKKIYIICYTGGNVLTANSEDNFNNNGKRYVMKISTEKTKIMVITKQPIQRKLEVKSKMIEQAIKFKYLST